MGGLTAMGSSTLRVVRLAAYLAWTLPLMPLQALITLIGLPLATALPLVYHRLCCRILGFQLRTVGRRTADRPALYVVNHVSYADITVLGALIPGSFVAKTEVAGWPLFGWLAKLQRTVFIDRRVRHTARGRDALSERLARRESLILFPEGTSGDGNRVLPFKSSLLGAAAGRDGGANITVQPVSIAYTRLDGIPIGRRYRPFFAWYGAMELAPHLWRLLGLGTIEVVVEFHPPTSLASCGSRKALAQYCQARVAGGVAAALSGRPQPMPDPPIAGPPRLGPVMAGPAIDDAAVPGSAIANEAIANSAIANPAIG
jgi:1-acyl-sn-glycerol-3-phosphate acyltransferase